MSDPVISISVGDPEFEIWVSDPTISLVAEAVGERGPRGFTGTSLSGELGTTPEALLESEVTVPVAEALAGVDAAVASKVVEVDDAITELGEFTSERSAEIDDKLTFVDQHVAAKDVVIDAAVNAANLARDGTVTATADAVVKTAAAQTVVDAGSSILVARDETLAAAQPISAIVKTTVVASLPSGDLEQGSDEYGVLSWRWHSDSVLETRGFIGQSGEFGTLSASTMLSTVLAGDTYIDSVEDGYGLIASGITAGGSPVSASGSEVTNTKLGIFGQVNAPLFTATVGPSDTYADTVEDGYGLIAQGITATGAFASPSLTANAVTIDQEQADIDRLWQRPDGVTRTAQWTMIPVYGESTSVGAESYPALSVTQRYSNLTFVGGTKALVGAGSTDATKPLVEDNKNAGSPADTTNHGETPASGMANTVSEYLLNVYGVDPASLQIFASTPGQGSQKVSDLSKGGAYYARLMGHVQAACDLASAAGRSFIVPAVPFICGANDASAGTSYAVVKAGLKQLAIDMDADIRAINVGQTLPVRTLLYVASGTFSGGAIEPVQFAQIDAAAESPLIDLTSPWYDLTYVDGVHANNESYRLAGRRIGIHVARYLMEGTPRPLLAVAASARGQRVRVRFSENVVIDASALPQAPQNGVFIVDASGSVPITSSSVDRGNLILNVVRPLVAPWKVRIALDAKGAGLTVGAGTTGHSSNIRAALTHSFWSGGVEQQIYRWAPHQQLSGISLEY